MTKEEQFVVNPLIRWFGHQNATWRIHKPRFGTAATGWDIEARRNKMDLLIEAKYIDGPFLASFTGLVTAFLANRPQRFMATKYRSWCYYVCWAIGTNYMQRNIFQILFDYIARNPQFWKHYAEDVRMKYLFFVQNEQVTRVPFLRMLCLAEQYAERAKGKSLRERRAIAGTLMSKFRPS